MMKKLAYSVQEGASMIGVSKSHLHRMVNEGVIRSVNLGNRKLIPAEALEDLISKCNSNESAKKEEVKGNDE